MAQAPPPRLSRRARRAEDFLARCSPDSCQLSKPEDGAAAAASKPAGSARSAGSAGSAGPPAPGGTAQQGTPAASPQPPIRHPGRQPLTASSPPGLSPAQRWRQAELAARLVLPPYATGAEIAKVAIIVARGNIAQTPWDICG